jgi:hypothetical protein
MSSGVENQPKFTVPFIRDPKFVGREDIMQDITDRLEMQCRIALCGIGGIGYVLLLRKASIANTRQKVSNCDRVLLYMEISISGQPCILGTREYF